MGNRLFDTILMSGLLLLLAIPIIYIFHYFIYDIAFQKRSRQFKRKTLKKYSIFQRFLFSFVLQYCNDNKIKRWLFFYYSYLLLHVFILLFFIIRMFIPTNTIVVPLGTAKTFIDSIMAIAYLRKTKNK